MISITRISISLAILLVLPFGVFAKCPISPTGTLTLTTQSGNLTVDTSGVDSVEVEVSNKIVPQEECKRDAVVVTHMASTGREIPEWRIRVPKGVTLDLTTQAGAIAVRDTDGSVTLRTSGGKVTVLSVKGNAAIITQSGEITAGNIGGKAEMRSGRGLVVGDVGGNADLHADAGDIVAGFVKGSIRAQTEGGNIEIRASDGQMDAITRVGSITASRVGGPFSGTAESGGIRVEQAGSWVKAFTGSGDIFIRLAEEPSAGDHHVDLGTGLGNIVLFLPEKMKATVDAVIQRSAFGVSRFFSGLPANAFTRINKGSSKPIPGGPEQLQYQLNGGGNLIKLRTSSGQIQINPPK